MIIFIKTVQLLQYRTQRSKDTVRCEKPNRLENCDRDQTFVSNSGPHPEEEQETATQRMEKFEIMRTEERNRYTLKRMREEALRRHRINMLRRRKHGRTVQGYVPRRRLRPGPRYRQSQNLPKLQQSRLELNSADADEDDFYQSDEVISRSGH